MDEENQLRLVSSSEDVVLFTHQKDQDGNYLVTDAEFAEKGENYDSSIQALNLKMDDPSDELQEDLEASRIMVAYDLKEYLEEHPEIRNAAVAYSGDSGFYSGASSMIAKLKKTQDFKEKYDLKEFAKTISYMPQSREIAELDVISLVKLARFAYKENQEITLDFAKNAISKLELEKYMYKSVSKLSYGERQKVYLAMLLAQDSKYMLLDEPTSFLDVDAKFYMWDLLKSLENKTRIVVTHDLLDAITFCDELIIIKDEKIIAYDSVDTILKNKIIEDVFDIDIEITNKKYFLKGKKKR
jgi:ABC-type cobalamin/Fe3+-siderophores transport system ATPase subunit